jgi:hypothetical protein
VAVHVAHGEIPSCTDCRLWLYGPDWRRTMRAGQPVARPPAAPSPCHKCPKSRDGRPNPAADLRGRNWLTYLLYQAVKAGLPMPDDLIAARNCAMIQMATDRLERQQGDIRLLLKTLFGGK